MKKDHKRISETTSVKDIGLSVRAMNACLANDLMTIADLKKVTEGELRTMRLFGRKAIDDVVTTLMQHHFSLRNPANDEFEDAVNRVVKIVPGFVPMQDSKIAPWENPNCISSTLPGSWKIIINITIMPVQMVKLVANFNVAFSDKGVVILTLKTV